MPSNLEQAAEAFREWRSTRVIRGQTPEHLKALATSLVGSYSNAQICEHLKINARALRVWNDTPKQPAEFVSLEPRSLESPSPELTLKLNCNGIDLHITGALGPDFIVSLLSTIKMEVL